MAEQNSIQSDEVMSHFEEGSELITSLPSIEPIIKVSSDNVDITGSLVTETMSGDLTLLEELGDEMFETVEDIVAEMEENEDYLLDMQKVVEEELLEFSKDELEESVGMMGLLDSPSAGTIPLKPKESKEFLSGQRIARDSRGGQMDKFSSLRLQLEDLTSVRSSLVQFKKDELATEEKPKLIKEEEEKEEEEEEILVEENEFIEEADFTEGSDLADETDSKKTTLKSYKQQGKRSKTSKSLTEKFSKSFETDRTCQFDDDELELLIDESELVINDVLMKLYLTDDIERVIPVTINTGKLVKEAISKLANLIHKDPEDIQLFYCGVKMRKKDQIFKYLIANEESLCIDVKFEFDSSSEESDISQKSFESDTKVLRVKVRKPSGQNEYLDVVMCNIAYSKEWCGGYRNKNTGIIYHNAWTQTYPRRQSNQLIGKKVPELNNRSTDTNHPTVNVGINTPYDRSTQTWRSDHYIPAITDKIMSVKSYSLYDNLRKPMIPEEAVRILQRFFRICILKKNIKKNVEEMREQDKAAMYLKGQLSEGIVKDRMNRLIGETFPMGRSDFYDAYTIIGIWKKNEKDKIMESKEGVARKAAMYELFEKLVKCLYDLETQRIRSKNESLKRLDMKNLETCASYVVRKYENGNLTLIDNLKSQRAREFKEIYSSYQRLDVKTEVRLDLLTTFKKMLGELENIDITKDLIQLLDRESDLIMCNIPKSKLVGLRLRIESMFLNLIKTPEYFKQVDYIKRSSLSKHPLYRCKGCLKLKSPVHFFSHLRLNAFKFCMSCSWMNTTATASVNLAPYTRLLSFLRESERKKCFRSAVAFLLQPMGMFYITNVIWNGRSCISGSTYLPELRMTRWNIHEEWAPWNTILLTQTEAMIHDCLSEPEKYYTRWFVLNVKQKLIISRVHFDKVYYTDLELRESGRWAEARHRAKFSRKQLQIALQKQYKNYFFDNFPGQVPNIDKSVLKVDVAC